ncbi:helix-turn-helix domain-containing protein [Priestia filamentosa]|uniref:helix-turn-helix domain-containing protein n=1 Tax=Priestia filamentosa TaxID=1402861 RepID=UPI000A08F2C8|nr:helix-turn-helix transcriptional regulator [Priestia filamentosa]MDT3763006.1 helix-turn-helix transcriptional regulator [Priestia filamentosa]OXS69525.1 hypothetical protein B1B01_11200 [Priestia filamentosa]WRU97444.1 helix-turn-helix transcriptional regulator [Priestia filamentosa]SMF33610.1 Helix-turn-helix [Priestia filamentosa]
MKRKADLKGAIKEKGFTQMEFGEEVGYDQSTISKWINGTRPVGKDAKPILARGIDSFKYYVATFRETTGINLVPFMDGKRVKRDVASLRMLVEKERREAMEFWDKDFWHVPAEFANETEREEARRFVKEYAEKIAAEYNLLAAFCDQYGFSLKEVDQQMELSFKSRGLVQ